MAHEKRSLNLIFLFCLVRSPQGTSLGACVLLPQNYRSFSPGFLGFHVQQTNRKFHARQLRRSKDPLRSRRSNSFRVDTGYTHSDDDRGRVARGKRVREYRELHFQLKTRLPFRSSTRSTNAPFANVLLIRVKFLPARTSDPALRRCVLNVFRSLIFI